MFSSCLKKAATPAEHTISTPVVKKSAQATSDLLTVAKKSAQTTSDLTNVAKKSAQTTSDLTNVAKKSAQTTSDLATGERYENGVRIKTLPPSVVKDIEQKNIARKLASISPIQIRVRRCLSCGFMFESSGNRTCGCSSRTAGTIAGREII